MVQSVSEAQALACKPNTTELLPLDLYDYVIVSFSGGKDSIALVLHLLDLGVPRDKIILDHCSVDGDPAADLLMDWPITHSYVSAFGRRMGMRTRFHWREGGFEREMLKDNQLSAPVMTEQMSGTLVQLHPTSRAKPGTRLKFPQVTSDLSVRWCSPYVKIDVESRAINNDPEFYLKTLLFLTGERRQESTARSKYAELEVHRSSCAKRRVDHWRAVLDWTEEMVWAIIRRYRINPHPAYWLGFGRVSCMACIFGNPDQWATIKLIAPMIFDRIAAYERQFSCTIHRTRSVVEQAACGAPYVASADDPMVKLALSRSYPESSIIIPEAQQWVLPSGAYKHCGGPT